MRAQYCREHVTPEVVKECGLKKSAVSDINQAAEFCEAHSDFSDSPTSAILAVIRIPDDSVRENTILSIEKSLESGSHPVTGKKIKSKRISARDVKKVAEKHDIALRRDAVAGIKAKKESDQVVDANKMVNSSESPNSSPAPEESCQPSLSAQVAGTVPPVPPARYPPDCKGGSGCPYKNGIRKENIRGLVCIDQNTAIDQISRCLRKEREAKAKPAMVDTGFTNGNGKPDLIQSRAPGAPAAAPLRELKDRTLTITFPPEEWDVLKDIQRAGEADGFEAAVHLLIQRAGGA